MPVEIAKGRHMVPRSATATTTTRSKRPHYAEALTAAQGEVEESKLEEMRTGSENPPKRAVGPVLHDFTHEAECLWWLSLWSVTARLGIWETVRTVFTPFTDTTATQAREMFLMYDNSNFPDLAEELPESLQPVYGCLRVSRRYLQLRFLELAQLDEKARADPAKHSRAFMSIRNLVNVQIPSETPPLVNGSNPFWTILESQGRLRGIELESTTAKRPHPVS